MMNDGMTKENTCCFTGHRNIPREDIRRIKLRLNEAIISAIDDGYRFFCAGGALGFDTFAAQSVLQLKKKYPDIRLILILPCVSQTKYWKEKDVQLYEKIKKQADKVIYTSQEYTKYCMLQRDRYLVEQSSRCICWLTYNSGGTKYTVDYARKKQVDIIDLAH